MQNVTMSRKGSTLTITVDLSKRFGYSKSGKTITVASTRGNAKAPGDDEIRVGLNVYAYPEAVAAE